MDDDIVVDFNQLLLRLRTFLAEDFDRKIFGFQHFELPVSRFGKWGVSKNDIVGADTYPNFLSGKQSENPEVNEYKPWYKSKGSWGYLSKSVSLKK